MQVQKIDPITQEDPVVPSSPSESSTPDYEDPEYADEDDYDDEDQTAAPLAASGNPAKRNLVLPSARTYPRRPASVVSQSSDHQKQHIVLDPLENLDATVHQSKGDFPVDGMVLQPGQLIPGKCMLILVQEI